MLCIAIILTPEFQDFHPGLSGPQPATESPLLPNAELLPVSQGDAENDVYTY